MSGGPACNCSEKREPFDVPGPARPGRLWRVLQRYGNCSAFNGYQCAPSDYSCLCCLKCGRVWRTKADYVARLSDIKDEERNISSGHQGHVQAMMARGRTPSEFHCE